MSDPTDSTPLPRNESRLDAMLEDGEQHELVGGREPRSGRWIPLTLAAALATAAVIGGAAWLSGRQEATPLAATPGGQGNGGGVGNPDADRETEVAVYYVGSTAVGPRLFREQHTVSGVSGDDLAAAVAEAAGSAPIDPDYRRFTSDSGLEATATRDGDQVTIDFSQEVARPDGMSTKEAKAALQSLVWTAGAGSSPVPVLFTVAGNPAAKVLGLRTSDPIEPLGADDILATVSISSPGQGDTLSSSTFTVKGEAATFEANVVWELKQGDIVVKSGFTTAGQCCTLSPYSFKVKAPPGSYTLHVHDTDESDGEGVGTSEDTKDLTVE